MNFTTATSFTTTTKFLMGKIAIITTVKIRTATTASEIASHTSFPKISLPTSQNFQRFYRLVYFLRIYVKYVHFRSWHTYITSSKLACKNLSYQQIYIPGANLYAMATQVPNAKPVFSNTIRHFYISAGSAKPAGLLSS